jgi:hypothetical protein
VTIAVNAEPLEGRVELASTRQRADRRASWARLLLRRPTEVSVALVSSGLVYLVGGWLLVFRYNSIQGDALSRVNNGAVTMFSRDPHLAAVGFVWNPLPSFLAMPLLLLRPVFPVLLSKGYASNIISAAAGAAAVGVLLLILRDWGLNRWTRWGLALAFALHPLVLYSGANGMTEALYLLFLLVACRYLARWLRGRATADLIVCGLALGFGYAVRYEVLVAGAAIGGLVFLARYVWSQGSVRVRCREAAVDFGIVVAPIAFVFIAWAGVSWIIVGSPFEQFTSQYGNSAQLRAMDAAGYLPASGMSAVHFGLRQMLLLNAALPVAALVPLIVGWRRRESAVLVPWAAFGSILAFELFAYARGQTASWLRYYIVAVPFVILSAATVLVDRRAGAPGTSDDPAASPSISVERRLDGMPAWWEVNDEGPGVHRRRGSRLARLSRPPVGIVSLAVVAAAMVGLASVSAIIHDHNLAREESAQLEAVFDRRGASETSIQALNKFKAERPIADYIASLHPGNGGVLIDSFYGFMITTQAADLKTYVVTSDRDFKQVLADPVTFHIKYIVVPDLAHGALDAINIQYPTMYDSGAGIATLLREFKMDDDSSDWRVYQVIENA